MFVRAVRFTDVDLDRIEGLITQVDGMDAPPEGVPSSGLQILLDSDQRTALVLQLYDSAEDMAAGEKVFDAMDAGETPGTRATVDRCELRVDKHM